MFCPRSPRVFSARTSLQALLDDASPGDTIYIPAGTHDVSLTTVVSLKNVVFHRCCCCLRRIATWFTAPVIGALGADMILPFDELGPTLP